MVTDRLPLDPPRRRASRALALILPLCAVLVSLAGPCLAAKPAKAGKDAAAPKLAPVFYPASPDAPRFQFLGTVTSSEPFQKKGGMGGLLFGDKQAATERRVERAYGVAMRGGRLYICDSGGGTGLIFDVVKREIASFDVPQPHLALTMPINIAFGPDGRKYVTDPPHGRLLIVGADDKPLAVIQSTGVVAVGPGFESRQGSDTCTLPAMEPSGVAVHGKEIFASDVGAGTIHVFDAATGCRIREIGSRGGGDGQFMAPANIAVDAQGYLYVTDMITARVQKIDRNGKFVRAFGSMGRRPGQFVRPRGVAVDPEGRLYVVDAATERIQVFDAEGRLLTWVGQPGDSRGGLNLPAGLSLATDAEAVAYASALAAPGFRIEYLVLVSNQQGPNKINLYGFGSMEGAGAAK